MAYSRVTLFLFALALSATLLSVEHVQAQETSSAVLEDSARKVLEGDQLASFRSQRLSIELIGRHANSYRSFSQSEGHDWYRWQAYRGDEPIPEHRFLSEAGRYQYAQEAESFHKDARNNLIAGVFLTAVGGAAIYVGYHMEDYLEAQRGPSKGMIGAGITVSGLGIGLSVANIFKARRQWAPFSRAYDITTEYNQQLIEDLRQGP